MALTLTRSEPVTDEFTIRRILEKITDGGAGGTDDADAAMLLTAAQRILTQQRAQLARLHAHLHPETEPPAPQDEWTAQIRELRDQCPEHATLLDQILWYIGQSSRHDEHGSLRSHRPAPTPEATDPLVEELRNVAPGNPVIENAADTIAALQAELAEYRQLDLTEKVRFSDAILAEQRARRDVLAEHDERPTTYLGRPQPGASPTFYMPDDVVVDGDWLEAEQKRLAEARQVIETVTALANDHGRDPARQLEQVRAVVAGVK